MINTAFHWPQVVSLCLQVKGERTAPSKNALASAAAGMVYFLAYNFIKKDFTLHEE